MPKIIGERCELVKLCHINCSGPAFLDTVDRLEALHSLSAIAELLVPSVSLYQNFIILDEISSEIPKMVNKKKIKQCDLQSETVFF